VIANEETAYLDLPEPLRALADTLWAVHTNDYDYVVSRPTNDAVIAHRARFTSRRWESAHPVVRVHPETGRRSLFIGGFAQRIVGLSQGESRDVLRLLQAYVLRPENQVRWHWQPGDLVLIDNRCTQHYAPDDYGDLPRELRRVTAAGEAAVGIDGGHSYIVSGDDAAHYTPAPD
jgi:taurine dioxygenase